MVEDREVTCVNCNRKLAMIADTNAAIKAHVEGTPMNLLNKVSDTVHRFVRHWIFESDFTFKTACGRYLKLGDAWKTPILVERPVTCKHCLRIIAASLTYYLLTRSIWIQGRKAVEFFRSREVPHM